MGSVALNHKLKSADHSWKVGVSFIRIQDVVFHVRNDPGNAETSCVLKFNAIRRNTMKETRL